MERVIVTVEESIKGMQFDLDLPLDERVGDLTKDIVASLHGYRSDIDYNPDRVIFINRRTGRSLNPSRTLRDECVWNGDMLQIADRGTIS